MDNPPQKIPQNIIGAMGGYLYFIRPEGAPLVFDGFFLQLTVGDSQADLTSRIRNRLIYKLDRPRILDFQPLQPLPG